MREFAARDGICRERRLELVTGGDYDELVTAATLSRSRIQAFLPIVVELADAAPRRPDWGVLYESLRGRAGAVVRAAGPPRRDTVGAAPPVETTVVWRCPDCGKLEETNPCIGVCVWRPVDWVELSAFESERAQALKEIEVERKLFALLTRFAGVKPHEGEWERNWLAFQAQARLVLGQ
ncbi:MAG TPA: hypothetical protein VMU39_11850 [Solirubrobacteraceae bacterium]|nr:hypothetical protein [Solirubrobacteraceae bacterium]